MANGTVLENLSTKKLSVLLLALSAIVMLSFAIGIASPKPATVLMTLFTACKVNKDDLNRGQVFYHQAVQGRLEKTCEVIKVEDMKQNPENGESKQNLDKHQDVVFVAEIPRSNKFVLSPFHQFIIALVDFQIQYMNKNKVSADSIWLDVRLGARNDGDSKWTELLNGEIRRNLQCGYPLGAKENSDLPDGYNYDCVPQPLFQLGATAYEHYILNIHVSSRNSQSGNSRIGNLYSIMMPVIFQNIKYTKILFSMKTVFTPFVLFALVWFWKRVSNLRRKLELIEKAVIFVGVMLLQLDFPIDWLSIFIGTPVILFISDIRQGLFFVGLLSFWIIFTGEHLVQKSQRNHLRSYWRELSSIIVCCTALFLFDLLERGVQIADPFYTIWSASDVGYNIAMGLIVTGAVSGTLYFCFLFYLVFQVFRSIKDKQPMFVDSMRTISKKQHIFEGIVFRFKFFMVSTLVLAAISIAFFVLVQVQESTVYFSTHNYNVDAVFSTGIFGMWNVYVVALLFLYAPSHRNKDDGFMPAANVFQLAQDEEESEEKEDQVVEDSSINHGDVNLGSSSLSDTNVRRSGLSKAVQGTSASSNVDDDVIIGGSDNEHRALVTGMSTLGSQQQPSLVYTMLGKQNMS